MSLPALVDTRLVALAISVNRSVVSDSIRSICSINSQRLHEPDEVPSVENARQPGKDGEEDVDEEGPADALLEEYSQLSFRVSFAIHC